MSEELTTIQVTNVPFANTLVILVVVCAIERSNAVTAVCRLHVQNAFVLHARIICVPVLEVILHSEVESDWAHSVETPGLYRLG